jgi:hypothetical protein
MQSSWTAGPNGISLREIVVSFQRYLRPNGDVIAATPPSLGALPFARVHSRFLVPLAVNEAFWIGVVPAAAVVNKNIALCVDRPGLGPLQLSMRLQGQVAVAAGFMREDGKFDAFCRGTFGGMLATVGEQSASVSIIDPKLFAARTGVSPGPVDPGAAYGGWRLP